MTTGPNGKKIAENSKKNIPKQVVDALKNLLETIVPKKYFSRQMSPAKMSNILIQRVIDDNICKIRSMVQQDNNDDSDAKLAAGAAAPGGEFQTCRICNQFIPVSQLAQHNHENHSTVSDLTCTDCGKLFKSKRSLFGHRKEKHSGVMEVHTCPECGKTFGRKSNLKAHRESLHYGKKFPCVHCDRIFTNRSSMNQHIKKTHMTTETAINLLTAGGVNVAGTINQITGN